MKILKILAFALLLTPLAAGAQTKSSQIMVSTPEMYPAFDNTLAANLWGRWRHDETQFSQQDYAMVIDLCIVAYDYLNAGYTAIINNNVSEKERKRLAADMNDVGISGNMVTFVRTFSNRIQRLASSGMLDEENVQRTLRMLERKKEFKRLNDVLQ